MKKGHGFGYFILRGGFSPLKNTNFSQTYADDLQIGVGIVSIPAGLVASALSKAREIETKESRNKNS